MQEKKYLEPLADTDEHTLDKIYDILRNYGATPDMFEYLADTVRGQVDRHGPVKIGTGIGIDRAAVLKHLDTQEPVHCELIIHHMDFAKASDPDTPVSRVVVGFKLDNGKIDQIVRME